MLSEVRRTQEIARGSARPVPPAFAGVLARSRSLNLRLTLMLSWKIMLNGQAEAGIRD